MTLNGWRNNHFGP